MSDDLKTVLTLGTADNESASLHFTLQRALQGSFEGSVWQDKFQNAQLYSKFHKTGESLAIRLENTLNLFKNSLESFQWPKSDPLFKGRLVVGGDDFEKYVSADVSKEGEAVRYYKFFSRGLDAEADADLTEGEYKFEVALGDDSEEFSIDVEADWTKGDLIDAVAEAINGSTLQVQAERVFQLSPGLRVPDLNAEGTSLLLAVNAGSAEQDLSLSDTQGHLLNEFDFSAVNVPTEPADLDTYLLSGGRAGKASLFYSDTFDPNAAVTLNAGVHSIDWSMGEQSGTFTFSVDPDDTWEDLLNKVADAAGGSQSMFSAEVVSNRMLSDQVQDQLLYMDGVQLRFEALDPKLGERLSITGGVHVGDGSFTVNDDLGVRYLEVSEEQYDAIVTGAQVTLSTDGTLPTGLAEDTTYYAIKSDTGRLIQLATSKTDAEAGTAIALTDDGSGDHSVTFTTEYPLTALGLGATAQPGSDTEVSTGGRIYERAAGAIVLDQGRLQVEIEENFSETIPLSVVEPLQEMQDRLSDVITSYNDLRSLLVKNLDILREETDALWRDPVTDNATDLQSIGLRETGLEKTLWFSHDAFYESLGADPERTQSLLLDEEDGLLTRWLDETQSVLDAGTSSLLINEASITDPIYGKPTPRTELELEKSNQLLDLFDQSESNLESLLDAGLNSGLVSKKG
ncbi:hypothetical protein [Salidesulfovibrio onnuriiensis]|uniref:hypothetical protein n=1 Tax=Salidesulfovibrio onnuriiensis TaxID=2583823 RepID=UPI0011C80704|nr:hypothetical protein [Salidesulfovibrio onnuriiensis]